MSAKSTATPAAGTQKAHAREMRFARKGAPENARMRPKRMSTPKMPAKVPRSRRWNHWALTLTIDRAPNDWKYPLIPQTAAISAMTVPGPRP